MQRLRGSYGQLVGWMVVGEIEGEGETETTFIYHVTAEKVLRPRRGLTLCPKNSSGMTTHSVTSALFGIQPPELELLESF